VRHSSPVILEGILDLAVLWEAGFRNTTTLIAARIGKWAGTARCRRRPEFTALD